MLPVATLLGAVLARVACDEQRYSADCVNAGCVWNAMWAPALCRADPCTGVASEQRCLAVVEPVPFPCAAPLGDPDYCMVAVCAYDVAAAVPCAVKPCLPLDEASCKNSASASACTWNVPRGVDPTTQPPAAQATYCMHDVCPSLSQQDCGTTPGCEFPTNGVACRMSLCGEYRNEADCAHDLKCHWDVSQATGVCGETTCGKNTYDAVCNAQSTCMWTTLNGQSACVAKTCDKYNHPVSRCDCSEDPDCAWHATGPVPHCSDPKFNACPDLDIAFILDGSGSMRRSFGRHAHGFYGLMEILRDWVNIVPLTGDDHTVGANAAVNTGAFRITFMQFSKAEATPADDHPTNCPIGACTNGLLSGRRDEINGDIDWHEANYQAQWTYVHDALMDVADHTFLPTSSPPGRQHIVILIADGGITDIDGDACCADRCGNNLCVDRNWKSSYPGILDAAQAKLRTEDVTVFGIVMRRFDYHTFQDDNAETKLKPLVSEPVEDHFMNLMLDEIPDSVLNTFCDPNSKFGKQVVGSATPLGCGAKGVRADCESEVSCVWDDAKSGCVESVCYKLCTNVKCNTNLLCAWNAGADRCDLKPPGCAAKGQTDCTNDVTCLWDPIWADSCIENPCMRHDANYDTCVSTSVTLPAPCDTTNTNVDFCTLEVCDHTSVGPDCEVKKCMQISKTTCENEAGCAWNGPDPMDASVSPSDKVVMCTPMLCSHVVQTLCEKDLSCKWNGQACAPTECAAVAKASDCAYNAKCYWDMSADVPLCRETACVVHQTEPPCAADDNCMWSSADSVCVPKTCDKYSTSCTCNTDADCVWHHTPNGAFCTSRKFNACPDLDIAFLLDGSGSMRRSFGRHAHGFYGLMEILRDWVNILPLTGDDHTVGANAGRDKGFRITFMQFSKAEATPAEDHPANCAIGQCTSGLLSGRRDEINGDIGWHEDNYQAQWTYVHDALMDVADHTFLPSQSPSWRVKLVIIIADGGITDMDGDACCADRCGGGLCVDRNWKSSYPGILDAAQAKLRTEDVTVFGIVMRRFDYHTFQDDNAETKLKPLVSSPADTHFMNLMLDEIPSVLDGLCDINSKFGQSVVQPTGCATNMDQSLCIADKSCMWDTNTCRDNACSEKCDSAICTSDPRCRWQNDECVYQVGCFGKDQAACENDNTCLWDPIWGNTCIENPCAPPSTETDCRSVSVTMPAPCSAPNGDPDFCVLEVCRYDASTMPVCEVKKCMQTSKTTCENEAGCAWNGPDPMDASVSPSDKVVMCTPMLCSHVVQSSCDSDAACKWNGQACAPTECAAVSKASDCAYNAKCYWDMSADVPLCRETACVVHQTEQPCAADDNCMWSSADSVCVLKTCEQYSTSCTCNTDADCVWHHTPNGAFCTNRKFNACPDLDIAFLLDGSGSMRRSFGRHAHGFYGLMEILRDWVNIVPLTGDDHTVGANAGRDKGFRITFMQFSKAEATPAEDHPANCAIGQCTSGLLSGRRDEINGDIGWHEDNYQAQWTYVHDALMDVADHTFLPSQSPSWRVKLVIIIADGGITDMDGDACCADRCGENLCMDKKWKPAYPGMLDNAQQKLRSEDVTVFGIVMRRFDYHTFQDDNAETKLKPLVSSPADTHFMNLMLDEIPSVLDGLCDINSKFGQSVVQPTGCATNMDQSLCIADKSCMWDTNTCRDNACSEKCDSAICTSDPRCRWQNDECVYQVGCFGKDQVACENDNTCLWDPIWGNTCIENPCAPPSMETDCRSVSVTMPAPCSAPNGDPDFCVLEVCRYDASTMPVCEVKKCMQTSKTTCENEAGCAWNGPDPMDASVSPSDKVVMCTPMLCSHVVQSSCDSDAACKWDGQKCVPTDECKSLTQEEDCGKNNKCHWNVAIPNPVCESTECAPMWSQANCEASDKCMWSSADSVCVPKTCEQYSTPCTCGNDASCVWHAGSSRYCMHAGFQKCPDLDIAFLLDGSSSMRRSFGRHAHGFYGLMEILRDWVNIVPLTGDDHTVGANAGPDRGFRITFMQFSKAEATPAEDHPTNCAIGQCTSGLLSGMRSELRGDIGWHEDNYQAQWTYVHDALMDVADHTFLPSQSPSWRVKLVIIIADGGITDIAGDDACCAERCGYNLCADRDWKPTYPGMLDYAQQKLRSEDVTVFGIVMRRFDYHTFQDDNAQTRLKPLVSSPADTHFMNLMLDEIPSVLDGLCDAEHGFASLAVSPIMCSDMDQTTCVQYDDMCVFSAALGRCTDAPCYAQCMGPCQLLTTCFWDGQICREDYATPAPYTRAPPTWSPSTQPPRTASPWTSIPATAAPQTPAPYTTAPVTPLPPVPAETGVPVAVSIVDECLTEAISRVCTEQDQLCRDPDLSVLLNWECLCVSPLQVQVSATASAVADCGYDECIEGEIVCSAAGQHCVDGDKTRTGNWACECIPPQTGARATLSPAQCQSPSDHWVCTAAGQFSTQVSSDEFECTCIPPAQSVVAGHNAAAECALDECTATCATCADSGFGNVCSSSGQVCEDMDTKASSLRDWRCVCVAPYEGVSMLSAAACTLNECVADCPTCAGGVCASAGQVCVDSSLHVSHDWFCLCTGHTTGRKLLSPAACEEDSCAMHGSVCTEAGQACFSDKDTPWGCRCPSPLSGVRPAGVALCVMDECTGENKLVCETYGQVCVDSNTTTWDSWACHCPPPSSGQQRLGAATCTLDECSTVCATCALTQGSLRTICAEAGQTCHDPFPTVSSVNDWTCTCVNGSPRSATTAAVATCAPGKDECVELSGAVTCAHKPPRYTQDGCMCSCDWTTTLRDTNGDYVRLPPGPGSTEPCASGCCNPDSDPSGEWCYLSNNDYNSKKPQCSTRSRQVCISDGSVPVDGGYPSRPQVSGVLGSQNNVCTDVGQLCEDPNLTAADDWMCKCVLLQVGVPAQQQPAQCADDECAAHGHICTTKGQTCKDGPRTNDWACVCKTSDTQMVGGAAVCPFDECVEVGPSCATTGTTNLCTVAGQTCEDPVPTAFSLYDWRCICPAPSLGSSVGGVVEMCMLDECVVACDTCAVRPGKTIDMCTEVGQVCTDVNKGEAHTNDWVCTCPPPSGGKAVANTARCFEDECSTGGSATCGTNKGQQCVDPDQVIADDWFCVCIAPAVGSRQGAPAVCEEDECKTNWDICAKAGQICTDPDATTPGDWVCACIAPSVGLPQQGGADCLYPDVCASGGDAVCAQAGQTCEKKSDTEFQCVCIAPYTGIPTVQLPAICELDECEATCATCEQDLCRLYGQECQDPDRTVSNNWMCMCLPPAVGRSATGTPAICLLDECVQTCPTCAGNTCAIKGQTCKDMDTSPLHLVDWVCMCQPPFLSMRTAAAVPVCTADECLLHAQVCIDAEQVCVDPQPTTEGDWECRCLPPYAGSAKNAPAAVCMLNECVATCVQCADSGNGNVCESASQVCEDPDVTVASNWHCKCSVGSDRQDLAPVQQCALDECAAQCSTCADTGRGNVCDAVGQQCVDENQAPWATRDWRCVCPPPLHFLSAVSSPAQCTIDECTVVQNGAVEPTGHICTKAGQVCRDSHLSTLNDFECVCALPKEGAKTAAVAMCTTDECIIHGDVCTQVGQACVDPDVVSPNTWACVCPLPSYTVQARGSAAACAVDECRDHRFVCEGASPVQQCVDTDLFTLDTWECRCGDSLPGVGVKQAAVCILDECEATCTTCEQDLCGTAGQTCVDTNPSPASLGDWTCTCPPSPPYASMQAATARVALCTVDECTAAAFVCEASNQTCVDPDTSVIGDWQCHCQAPASGQAMKGPSICLVDECKTSGHVCATQGQVCMDEHKGEYSLNDWVCQCPPPVLTQAQGEQRPAVCVLIGECADPVNSDVCTSAGQMCVDPQVTVLGDWLCVCVPQAQGVPGLKAPATCLLDECMATCETCAGATCRNAAQACVDDNKDPLTGRNSWECRCVAPASGTQVGAAAVCVVDECDVFKPTCAAAGQLCLDDNQAQVGDWQCVCKAPEQGAAVAGVAMCLLDECDTHGHECAARQTCLDLNRDVASLQDWTCQCNAPYAGSAAAKAAVCMLDECALYGHICTGAGMTCVDSEQALEGFWKCYCAPPNEKVAKDGGVPLCIVDECRLHTDLSAVSADQTNVCEENGQTCVDPNRLDWSVGDWYCQCPTTTQTAMGHVAVCLIDECDIAPNSDVCSAVQQQCVDASFVTVDDWACRCVPPSVGTSLQAAAVCVVDECSSHGADCHAYGQVCLDPVQTGGSLGDWECRCPEGLPPASAVAAKALCTLPSECALGSEVCAAQGQTCMSSNLPGAWACACLHPATGSTAVGQAATCILDECTTTCATCAGDTCAHAGQGCTDPNTNATSLGDWLCLCPHNTVGIRTGAAVPVCQLDECTASCATCSPAGFCASVGSLCHDPDTDARSTSDWMCICTPPSVGNATMRAPVCLLDECKQYNCGQGQTCTDPDRSPLSQNDFVCSCPNGQTGYAMGASARCTVDECSNTCATCADKGSGNVCEIAGQRCEDASSATLDWSCVCNGASKLLGPVASCGMPAHFAFSALYL